MHKRAQGSHHASTHLHASTSWAQESTREPSHHSEFDLSSIYQISQAADALAAVDDMGGLAESSAAPVQTVEEILGQAEEMLRHHSPHLFAFGGFSALEEEEEPPVRDTDSPCLIILPENRVCVIDDELNPRVRAQLLGEDVKRKPRKRIVRPTKVVKPQNPWYIPADQWYKREEASDDAKMLFYEVLAKEPVDDHPGQIADPEKPRKLTT